MTTPLIPDFIIDMYENEMRKFAINLIDIIANKKKLDKGELYSLVEKGTGFKLDLVSENKELIKIVKVKPRKLPSDEERCIARTLRNGIYCRCTFHKTNSKGFCKRHNAKPSKFGTINDPDLTPHDKRYNKIY